MYLPPEPPEFTDADRGECLRTGDYRQIAFEWYKYVGLLTAAFMQARYDSPAFAAVKRLHFDILVGLLNRCCRLMLSNLRLSHEGRYGETTRIIDRCLVETCVKIVWLCSEPSEEHFQRFLADGLKADVEFRGLIQREISARGGAIMPIETRMLQSIERVVRLAELDDAAVQKAKRMPDMASILKDLGYDRLSYVILERMPSHATHGTWTDLMTNYLQESEGELGPRDHDVPMDLNQFMLVATLVLRALRAFIEFMVPDAEEKSLLLAPIERARLAFEDIQNLSAGTDFTPADQP